MSRAWTIFESSMSYKIVMSSELKFVLEKIMIERRLDGTSTAHLSQACCGTLALLHLCLLQQISSLFRRRLFSSIASLSCILLIALLTSPLPALGLLTLGPTPPEPDLVFLLVTEVSSSTFPKARFFPVCWAAFAAGWLVVPDCCQ